MIAKKFQELPLLVKIILLIIPGVNWITEIVVRLSSFLYKKDTFNLIGLILGLVGGLILGYLDIIWIILFGRYFFQKA